MKRFALAMLALSGLAGLGIWLVASRPVTAPAPLSLATPRLPNAPQEITFVAPAPKAREAGPAPGPTPPAPPVALITDPATAARRIHALATTFDAANAPELAGYLQHPSREVRQNATKGLMLLGDVSAVPALKQAAKTAEMERDEALAAAYYAAADYLAQPRTDEAVPPPTPLHVTEQSTAEMWREKALKPESAPAATASDRG